MTIISVVADAATELGIAVPTAVFGIATQEMVEMRAMVNEVARDIAEAGDWQALRNIQTVTGNGSDEEFDLAADYDRMLRTASLWSSRWLWAINHVVDADQWIERQVLPVIAATGDWIIFGGKLHVLPIMASGETVKFFYISNAIVKPETGPNKAAFTADTDTFRLPERLLKLGIIARWKKAKGLAYAQADDDFINLRSDLLDKDQGSKPILSGAPPRSLRGRKIAWPGTVTGAP